MNQRVIAIIAVLVVLIGGWYLVSRAPESAPIPGSETNNVDNGALGIVAEDTETMKTIRYTDAGYVPNSVTIPVGGTITWVNDTSKNMWVASAMHPTHTAYSGTNLSQHCPDTSGDAFDQCTGGAPGTTYSFTFDKAGTWRYHDHIDATKFGSVVVTAQ